MGLAELMRVACAAAGLACGAASAPTLATIQAAYEREAAGGSALHDKGLKVIEAACDGASGERFLCQVTFLSGDDPTERLYYDVVAVARSDSGWELKSGLCKR